jgi:hypothetical protein
VLLPTPSSEFPRFGFTCIFSGVMVYSSECYDFDVGLDGMGDHVAIVIYFKSKRDIQVVEDR